MDLQQIPFSTIEGIKIGHEQNLAGPTGCTVVICKEGAVAGVEIRGGAPGTRETDVLSPGNLVDKIHAVVLAGGSAFGLAAASGAMTYLEENDIGFDVGVTKVPLVCSAVLYDLALGDPKIRPTEQMGYQACKNSEDNADPDQQGNVGAGAGAMLGKIRGTETAMKGGLGSYALQIGELKVGALVAVNCLGDVLDSSQIIAGTLNADKTTFLGSENALIQEYGCLPEVFKGNTTLGIVVTNAKLSKVQATKVASMAHDGYARCMRPAHTMVDGDTIFTLSTGTVCADLNAVGILAANVMQQAIINAVKSADSILGCKSHKELFQQQTN